MAKIRHIALSTHDVEKTARFYIDVFGLKQVGTVDDPGTRGVFLSDGDINLAILDFKNDVAAGAERGRGYRGLHHIGFQVDNLDAIAERLAAAGAARRDDINDALGVGHGRYANVEVKYGGPDGVVLDVSETGWIGTSGFGRAPGVR
jgi:catechol 2,3-dioxygenase-like lactoylglutathione lyase family enzyme